MITLRFPDQVEREFDAGVTPIEIAKSISEGFARNVLSTRIDGELLEANQPITKGGNIQFFTWNDAKGKEAFWHSSAHVLAQAVLFYYPEAKLTIGPAIDKGFYYDFDFGQETLSEHDFERIEKKALELASQKSTFDKYEVSKTEALKEYQNNPFKTELIENLEDGDITFCKHADFVDLCRGGHIPHTGLIKAFKVMSVAGAYWRGDETKPQLTRLYGISFPKKSELNAYLEALEEAKKRDHRKIGKELQLFTFSQNVGQGLPLWLPKGAAMRRKLEDFLIGLQKKQGYEMVSSPHIGHKNLYETSGHYEKYGEDSFQPIHTPDHKEEYLLKPMNCPHHCEIYKNFHFSYRDLPKRFAEFGTVYRYEQSGELHGLTRVRGFTQDDAHIFCTQDQLEDEFKEVIKLVMKVFGAMGFHDFLAQVSLPDPDNMQKYIGSQDNWDKAEQAIRNAAQAMGLKTVVEYGEAAFYGPKLDFMIKDALGREWQLGTIQVDYNLPERFDLSYKGSDNENHRPVMIHRAPFGSLERFIAILLEHTAGNLPLWLSPQQVRILPLGESHLAYAKEIEALLKTADIEVSIDARSEKTGRKIRDAEIEKVPFMIVLGNNEVENQKIALREKGNPKNIELSKEELLSFLPQKIEQSYN